MEIERKGKSARIILGEKLDLTNAEKMKEKFKNLIEKNIMEITIDFKEVEEIDSAGLGKILYFNKIIQEQEGSLQIENVNSEYVKKVFDLIELDKVIEIKE